MSAAREAEAAGLDPLGESILLIDDDDMVRRAFGRLLGDAGFRVRCAENGERALEMFRELTPDAVVVDLAMPGMSGLEVLTVMTRASPDMPIVVISGTGVIEDVVQALRRGAWDYVTKPVEDAWLLVKVLRRALERAVLLRENRQQRGRLEELNARLTSALEELQADQEAGRRIQFAMLPADATSIGRYTFSRRLFPSQSLSGDFVDYFSAGEHHAAMYLADVSGHGAASAFVTAMVAALVLRHREELVRGENDVILHPDRLLEALNRDLRLRKLHKHVTMFYGVLDLRSDVLRYGNAGQYPFPLLGDGKSVRLLETSGRPLGLFAEAHYPCQEVHLGSMRSLCVPSDGVLEVLPEGDGTPKLERLAALFGRAATMDALVHELGLNSDLHYPDDVALLLVERSDSHG